MMGNLRERNRMRALAIEKAYYSRRSRSHPKEKSPRYAQPIGVSRGSFFFLVAGKQPPDASGRLSASHRAARFVFFKMTAGVVLDTGRLFP